MAEREPRVGEWVRVVTQSVPMLFGKEVQIKRVNWATIDVRPFRGREDISLLRQDIEYLEPESLISDEKREVVKRLVIAASITTRKKLCIEIGFLNQLIAKYPDPLFWRAFEPGFQVQSLNWFIGGGSNDLVTHYNKYSLDFKSKTINIGSVKLGEDAVTTKKKPNLKGWLEN